MFTCTTLDAMLGRHGWEPVEHAVYLQQVKTDAGDTRSRLLATGARAVLGLERCWPAWAAVRGRRTDRHRAGRRQPELSPVRGPSRSSTSSRRSAYSSANARVRSSRRDSSHEKWSDEHEEEAERQQHERGRRVGDPEQVGHPDEQVGEHREHREPETDGEPQDGVLGAEPTAADEMDDERDHRGGEDDHEDVRQVLALRPRPRPRRASRYAAPVDSGSWSTPAVRRAGARSSTRA